MHAGEDRLSSVLCGEPAHHTFRSLGEKIQRFWNVCIEGLLAWFSVGFFFQSSIASANQVVFQTASGRWLKILCCVLHDLTFRKLTVRTPLKDGKPV